MAGTEELEAARSAILKRIAATTGQGVSSDQNARSGRGVGVADEPGATSRSIAEQLTGQPGASFDVHLGRLVLEDRQRDANVGRTRASPTPP